MPISTSTTGMSMLSKICDTYGLNVTEEAQNHFIAEADDDLKNGFGKTIKSIFEAIGEVPKVSLNFVRDYEDNSLSPHNFKLVSGRTMSVRTCGSSSKVAPRIIGQAGMVRLNEYFADINGGELTSDASVKKLMTEHISEVFPYFVDAFLQSDVTVVVFNDKFDEKAGVFSYSIFYKDKLSDITYPPECFSFTKSLREWNESTTLKINNVSIAEIQIHSNRSTSFKFRFIVKNLYLVLHDSQVNNETLGISAEAAICKLFNVAMDPAIVGRTNIGMIHELTPVVEKAFINLPRAIKHTGSEQGARGGASKCEYDILLAGNLSLSLKTNSNGFMVCPPNVGQPGAKACKLYFEHWMDDKTKDMTPDIFKNMVFNHIGDMLRIYAYHLFDSDYLLWIFKKGKSFDYRTIGRKQALKIMSFHYDASKFTFTKPDLESWNESNTVKYNGKTIGEFQVHKHRSSYKFRFNLLNFLELTMK